MAKKTKLQKYLSGEENSPIFERLKDKKVKTNEKRIHDNKPDNTVKYIDISLLEEAPPEWKICGPLNDNKFQVLKESISKFGLLHPIHIWKYEERCIILSGHERVRAFKELLEETKEPIYREISSKIEKVRVLDKDRARKLIAVGNIQREASEEEYKMIHEILYKKS
jgi:ParB family chromosome partitioning protein